MTLDPVVERNRALLHERSQLGLKKYGRGLGNPLYLTQKQALQHALEEALDLANYLQAEIMRIEEEEQRALKDQNQCDGCMQGAELRGGMHVDRYGYTFMVCERGKYGEPG